MNAITARRRQEAVTAALLLAGLIALPLPIHDVYTRNLFIITLLFAGLSQSWNILGGLCGQISLGHSLYFGVGAYVSTLLFVGPHISPWLGMCAAFATGGLLALLIGLPCFRLSGHYYAIATVVVQEIGYLLFLNWDWVGAASGVYIPFRGESWASLQFRTAKLPYFYLTLGFAALTWLIAWWVEGSRLGYSFRAVKDDAVAAGSLGVRILPAKMVAALISGGLTGMGGAIFAQYVGYIDPDSILSGSLSILIALPAVLGGVGTLWGPLLGAAVLIPLRELSSSFLGSSGSGVDLMLYGALIMAVSLLRPQGLLSLLPRATGKAAP